MPSTAATLSTASTTPLLTTRREWPLTKQLHHPRKLPDHVNTLSPSSSSNGTNMITLTVVIIALLTLTLSSVAVGLYRKYNYRRLNHQKTSTTADFNHLPFELPDHHDSESDREDEEKAGDEEEEEGEELYSLERVACHLINTNNQQIKLCIAQVAQIYPPGSASMVDIRNSGHGAWYSVHGLPNSKSVRDVSTLPDLTSARAILSRRSDDGLGRSKKDFDAEDGNLVGKSEKKKRYPAAVMRMVAVPPEPEIQEEAKGLRQALRKRISTPRFGFQGGSVRELVRSIGF